MKKLPYLSIIFQSFIEFSLRAQLEVHSIAWFISGGVGTQRRSFRFWRNINLWQDTSVKYRIVWCGIIEHDKILLYSVELHGVTLSSYGQILS